MQVIRGINDQNTGAPLVLTIGSFDGVHLGHQQLLETLKKRAAAIGGRSALMTFTPHPRIALNKDRDKLRLLTNDFEKEALLKRFGLDVLFLVPFDSAFSQQEASVFLHEVLLKQLGVKHLVIGYDHRFGKNRGGDFSFLQSEAERTKAFSVEEISQQTIDDLAISSTKIRLSLETGDVGLANKLLGYHYSLRGTVVKGDQIGRRLGYPTANLATNDPYKQIPGAGVYATEAKINGHWLPAMTYIGMRPTINGQVNNIETNIFDFQGDLYGQTIEVAFCCHMRHDLKFDSLEELTAQISIDERKVRLYFGLV
jgi:riboflavin kinase/FMN adenylyltransferase